MSQRTLKTQHGSASLPKSSEFSPKRQGCEFPELGWWGGCESPARRDLRGTGAVPWCLGGICGHPWMGRGRVCEHRRRWGEPAGDEGGASSSSFPALLSPSRSALHTRGSVVTVVTALGLTGVGHTCGDIPTEPLASGRNSSADGKSLPSSERLEKLRAPGGEGSAWKCQGWSPGNAEPRSVSPPITCPWIN